MNNYFKTLTEDNIRYKTGLMKGVKIYEGVPHEENLFKMDKFIFKNGDLMGEISQEEFPFKLKKDTCFTLLSVKGEAVNYIIEVESPTTYFIKYCVKDYVIELIASYNEKVGHAVVSMHLTDSLKNLFKVRVEKIDFKDPETGEVKKAEKIVGKNASFLNQLQDITGSNVSKMISIISNDDYNLSHSTRLDFSVRTKKSIKNIGKATLVTTRHKNMLHICDAYPYFYDVDFKRMALENPVKEE